MPEYKEGIGRLISHIESVINRPKADRDGLTCTESTYHPHPSGKAVAGVKGIEGMGRLS